MKLRNCFYQFFAGIPVIIVCECQKVKLVVIFCDVETCILQKPGFSILSSRSQSMAFSLRSICLKITNWAPSFQTLTLGNCITYNVLMAHFEIRTHNFLTVYASFLLLKSQSTVFNLTGEGLLD